MMMSSYLICTLPEQGCCVLELALTRNIGSIVMHRRQSVAIANAHHSNRGAIRAPHDLMTWVTKLRLLETGCSIGPTAILERFNSTATTKRKVVGNRRVSALALLNKSCHAGCDRMIQLLSHVGLKAVWQEARANRRMQFKVGNYRDGDKESNIRMLTGTIKADWIQLPVERYLAALPTLRQGVIAGVFRNKGAAPWAITRAEKLQLSVFLPNDLSLDDWYAGVYALPTVWPDVSMLGADNLRKVVGYDFHHLRKKYDVLSMWGNIHPQWRLLKII